MAVRGFLYALAEIQFINLRDFSDDMEKLIKESTEVQIQHLEELSQALRSNQDKEEFWEYNLDRVHQLKDDYPNILRSSLLVSCMSNMEKVLVGIYEDLKLRDLNLKSLRNKSFSNESTIRKVFLAIGEAIHLHNVYNMPEWDRLLFYNELRNRVVHDTGKVYPEDYPDLSEKIKNSELVSLSNHYDLVFVEDFAKQVNFDCTAILKRLLEEINNYFKNQASS
ncbi:hypothetical protein [Paenibacillus illinoisensis]|uniref:Cthe-2314-like HEPN domain-containing protein n=1 Tax=Paenibacillus illinoisensis TaxID=59845 RepID=A0A2W0CX09_9BACL|nr:hypothetical protein [Paenibacillus illinoisensis]PYY28191.1 Uncharacterized protein PIL02S_03337 [Paenibacillus illinoisensis]